MAGGYQPLSCPAMNERSGEHLPSHMIGYAHHRHDGQHHGKRTNVDWNGQDQRRYHHRAGQRLPRVEAHRRPRGRRMAGVMDRMDAAIDHWAMHPAMRPVKPRIMEREIDDHRTRQPPPGVSRRIGI